MSSVDSKSQSTSISTLFHHRDVACECLSFLSMTEILFVIPLVNRSFRQMGSHDALWRPFVLQYLCHDAAATTTTAAPSTTPATTSTHSTAENKTSSSSSSSSSSPSPSLSMKHQWINAIKDARSTSALDANTKTWLWPNGIRGKDRQYHQPLPSQRLILPPLLAGLDVIIETVTGLYSTVSFFQLLLLAFKFGCFFYPFTVTDSGGMTGIWASILHRLNPHQAMPQGKNLLLLCVAPISYLQCMSCYFCVLVLLIIEDDAKRKLKNQVAYHLPFILSLVCHNG
jgi:hypothetical protein